MMETIHARLLRRLSACLILLLLMDTSTAEDSSQNFMNVMEHDQNLCSTGNFLKNSTFTKRCKGIDFPKEELQMNFGNWDKFTCLVVYDTWYKLCNYSSQWKNPFNSTTEFNSLILKITQDAQNTNRKAFCKSINRMTPVYEKTKHLITPFMNIINGDKCNVMCFLSEQLDPLCALLAWISNVDEQIKKIPVLNTENVPNVKADKKDTLDAANQDQTNEKPDPVKVSEELPEQESQPKPEIANTQEDNKKQPAENKESKDNKDKVKPVKEETTLQGTEVTKPKGKEKTSSPSSKNVEDIIPDQDKSLTKDTETVSNENQLHKNVDNTNDPNSLNPNDKEKTVITNEEAKANTISENTQDRADIGAHEYGRVDSNERYDDADQPLDGGDTNQNVPEPSEQRDIVSRYQSIRPEEDSHFFTYFTIVSLLCVAGYIGYHNKQKILAIVVEGRRSRNNRGRRRPSTASYRKLDCTLEEAVTSQCNANVTHVIY